MKVYPRCDKFITKSINLLKKIDMRIIQSQSQEIRNHFHDNIYCVNIVYSFDFRGKRKEKPN